MEKMRSATALVCLAVVLASTYVASGQQRAAGRAIPAASEWPTYGHDAGGMRYSPVTQLTPANVSQLQPAWVYHMKAEGVTARGGGPGGGRGGGRGGASGFAAGETTPLVINGIMYVSTPYGR